MSDMTKEQLTVRGVRAALGLTQSQLGQIINTHPITISRWERGLAEPTAYTWGLLQVFAVAAMHRGVPQWISMHLASDGPIVVLAYLLRNGIRT